MFKISDIKKGMEYNYVRDQIVLSNNLIMTHMNLYDNFDVIEDLRTSTKIYIKRNKGLIEDIKYGFNQLVEEVRLNV